MPRYLDRHPTQPLPPEVLSQIVARLQSGQPDEFGEIGLNVFVGERFTSCHTEAPSVEAVCKSHAALGVELDPSEVQEVQVLP